MDVRHSQSRRTPPVSLNALGPGKIVVLVTINGIATMAMIDSGAGRDFMSATYAEEWGLPLFKKKASYLLALADGNLADHNSGTVSHETKVDMEALGQKETIRFDITNLGETHVILGLPWLQRHNPHIDWKNLTVTLLESLCSVQAKRRLGEQENLSPRRMRPSNVEVVCCYLLVRQDDKPAFEIPKEYLEFSELFTEEAPEEALPLHRDWDHEIALKPGTQLKKFKIYPLTKA